MTDPSPKLAAPRETPDETREERLQRLSRALQAAGVLGRVQLGVSRTGVFETGVSGTGVFGTGVAGVPARRPTPAGSPDPAAPGAEALLEPLRRSGALVEISGPRSCGRTALAYRAALDVTRQGGWVGWIDPADALDPRFAQRAGIPLERLLWVRPVDVAAALRAAELVLKTGFTLAVLDLAQSERRAVARLGAACWVRLQRAARRARAVVLVLAPEQPFAGSFATARLEIERTSSRFDRGLFEGYRATACWARDRAGPTPDPHPLQIEHRPR